MPPSYPLYTVGDSHCQHGFQESPHIARTYWLGPYTMHRVGRDGLRLDDVRVTPYGGPLVVHSIPKDGIVIACFGEVDVRAHVHRQVALGRASNEVLATLADAYVETWLANQRNGYTRLVLYAIRPPMRCIQAHLDIGAFQGTTDDHKVYRDVLNARLREACARHGFGYFDPHAAYTDDEGLLDKTKCDDCTVHVIHTPAFDAALEETLKTMGWWKE